MGERERELLLASLRVYIQRAIAQISTRGDPAAKIGEDIKWGSKITSSCLGQVCDFLCTLMSIVYPLSHPARAPHYTRAIERYFPFVINAPGESDRISTHWHISLDADQQPIGGKASVWPRLSV